MALYYFVTATHRTAPGKLGDSTLTLATSGPRTAERSGIMAIASTTLNAIFLATILMEGNTMFFIEPCTG